MYTHTCIFLMLQILVVSRKAKNGRFKSKLPLFWKHVFHLNAGCASISMLESLENSKIYCYIVILKSVQFPAILSWITPFKSGLVVIDCMQPKMAGASCNRA